VPEMGKNIDFVKLEFIKIRTSNTQQYKKVSISYNTGNEGIRKGIFLRSASFI
jgi:hypothetical protein